MLLLPRTYFSKYTSVIILAVNEPKDVYWVYDHSVNALFQCLDSCNPLEYFPWINSTCLPENVIIASHFFSKYTNVIILAVNEPKDDYRVYAFEECVFGHISKNLDSDDFSIPIVSSQAHPALVKQV